MGLENLARSRKQDLIFAILKKHAKNGEKHLRRRRARGPARTASASCARPDSSYLARPGRHLRLARRRSAASTCTPATRSRARSARRRTASATSRWSRSTRSTATRPRSSKHKILFENLTPLFPTKRLKLERDNGSTEDLTGAHHRHHRADRQRPARPDRLAAEGRQDGDAAAHRAPRSPPTIPTSYLIVLLIDERPGGSDRDAAHGARRSRVVDVRRARRRATCRSPRW